MCSPLGEQTMNKMHIANYKDPAYKRWLNKRLGAIPEKIEALVQTCKELSVPCRDVFEWDTLILNNQWG